MWSVRSGPDSVPDATSCSSPTAAAVVTSLDRLQPACRSSSPPAAVMRHRQLRKMLQLEVWKQRHWERGQEP